MKGFKKLFKSLESPETTTATIEAPKPVQPQQTATVTVTKKNRQLGILQPAPPAIVAKMLRKGGPPPMSCVTCSIGALCPEYDEAAVCAFNEYFKGYDTRNKDDVVAIVHEVFTDTKERYRRARYAEERINGGMPLPEVTRLGKDLLEQSNMVLTLNNEEEATLSMQAQGSGADILRDLFMAPPSAPRQLPNPVQEPVVIHDPVDGSRVTVTPNED